MGLIAEELTGVTIGAAIEVHRLLGPGLLESAYEECLARELSLRQIPFARQVEVPVTYKQSTVACAYRADLVVGGAVLVELKAVETIVPVHEAQLLTYLRLMRLSVGLLLNFNVVVMRQGIVRRVL